MFGSQIHIICSEEVLSAKMFIHCIIKLKYITMGYLPGYPYYLISDKEMFDAFLREDGFFNDFYPCPSEDLREAYDALRQYIVDRINDYLSDGTEIPAWVYSYMIMNPVTFESDEADIAYICKMGNVDYPGALAEFNEDVAEMCYKVSSRWIQKQPSKHSDRPATMFGEAHVIKSLRLDEANILSTEEG